MPEGKANVPMLLFIHGGGWRGGDKVYEGLNQIVNICADMGMGVMSINYRLALKHPAHIQDVARAFAFLYNNAAQMGVDRTRIFVAGASAGGHLAALLGADPRYLGEQNLSPKLIKGVMSFSGVYDMANWYSLSGALGSVASKTAAEGNSSVGVTQDMLKIPFGTDYEELRSAGAATYIGKMGKETPPYLIAYTDDDFYGMAEQATSFYSLFVRNHLAAELVEQPGRVHATKTSGIGAKLNGADVVLGSAIERFMRSVLKGTFGDTEAAVWPADGTKDPAIRIIKDLRYDDSPGSDPKLNALDLYMPEGKENVPLVFYLHGGGWRAGDKENPATLVNTFGRLGVGVASVNYRISPQVKHPIHIQDVARAFAWVYKNAGQYKIDRNRIVLVGGSAGGHLASLLALDTEYLTKEGIPPDAIKGVASISGVYDLPAFSEPGKIPTRKEQAFGHDNEALRLASPVSYIASNAPPFLITFTDWDLFMIREQSLEMYNLMLHKGNAVELVMLPGRNHMGIADIGKNTNLVDDVLGPTLTRFVAERLNLSQAAGATAKARQ